MHEELIKTKARELFEMAVYRKKGCRPIPVMSLEQATKFIRGILAGGIESATLKITPDKTSEGPYR